jgi:glycine reductase complex component B subunit gamma
VGAVRIVGAVSIPHPVGDPALPQEKEHELRMNIVKSSLELLKADF